MCGVISRVAMAGVVAFFVLFAMGCEGDRGPAGPPGVPEVFIGAKVETAAIGDSPEDTTGNADVTIYNLDVIPEVSINGIAIPYEGSGIPLEFSTNTFPIRAGDQAILEVRYTEDGVARLATSAITMPDSFEITSPDPENFVLYVGENMTVTWSAASHTNGYYIWATVEYGYYGVFGDYNHFFQSYVSITADTWVDYSVNELFPSAAQIAQIDTMFPGRFSIDIWAISGPILEEQTGNFVGDGGGVFNGWTHGCSQYFDIVMPPAGVQVPFKVSRP